MTHTVLLTGASGMLGSRAALALCQRGHRVVGVDIAQAKIVHENYTHVICDLTRPDDVAALFAAHPVNRVIHLAALAHVTGETDLSWNRYFMLNVLVSQHVFEQAAKAGTPVFFASTVDVYGLQRNVVSEATTPAPVGGYARSKYMAEQRLLALMGDTPAFIARFAPVYTADDMRDVRKRCYIKYPSLAFTVGGGTDYAFLDLDRVVEVVCAWADRDPAPSGLVDFCDDAPFNSAEMVTADRDNGKAGRVLRLPGWMGKLGLGVSRVCPPMLRLNVNKVLNPYRFDTTEMKGFFQGGGGAPFYREKPDLRGVRVLLLEGFARQNMALMPALKALGCHLTTYNSSKLDVGYASRWPDVKLIRHWDREDPESSFEALMAVLREGHYDVVIPMTDFSATLLCAHIDEVRPLAWPAVNEPDAFWQAADKQRTMQACDRAGVPCPRTLYDMQSADEIMAAGLPFPFIIKPRVGYGSIGFHVIRDEAQLREVFPKALERFGGMVVQEYIPQTGTQYKCEVFLDAEGAPKSAVVFDKTRWYPVDGGSTCCSCSVHRPDIAENSIRLLQAIGWRGYGDVDLIEDPRDGVAKVMEINPRITASVKVCFAAGVDFARQIVELGMGLPVTEYTDYKDGVRLRYMHTDVLWFLQSPNRFKTKPGWFDFRHTTDQIFNPRDPWPWFTYTVQGLRKRKTEMAKRKR
ncbi:MAG: NAD-dependent epimerase/dehydratase family protein [Clostridia bacterium]|nr:NAD-dependent epimerase/dehydratase family protein [Clostridia bacterium]